MDNSEEIVKLLKEILSKLNSIYVEIPSAYTIEGLLESILKELKKQSGESI